jgi:hypothetical protein
MSDPMKKVITGEHPQKPRTGHYPDGKEMGRNTAGSQVPEYDGYQRDGTSDGAGEAKSRDEKSY